MMNTIFFAICIFMISKIEFAFQLSGAVCKNVVTGSPECCFNYENVNSVCTQCKNGTMSKPGGRCLPCKQNTYGYKCVKTCQCDYLQRCDAQIGCTQMTSEDLRKKENGTTTKDSTNMKNGPYLQEWLIYTLCIGGFVLIIVLSHFLRSYRRLPSSTKADETEKNDTRHDAVQSPYIRNTAIYDEIDEYMLEDDRGESTTVQNLKRIHSNDNINDNQSDNTIIKQEESSSYLEPVFVEKENETRNSFKESSLGLSSNTYCTTPVRTRFYNRNEFRQESADGYEVPVHVHKYESSSAAMSREEESLSNPCYNVYQQLLGDQNTNNNAYEESIKLYNEKDINIDETHIQDELAITKRDRDHMDCLIHVVTTTRSREEVKHPKIELCCSQTKMGQNSENKAGNSENV